MSSDAWAKILSAMNEEPHPLSHGGCIPVYDGSQWRVFRNSLTIYPGAENCADPAKVDKLRLNIIDLLDHYPETVPKLAKLGIRVRALLNREIKTYDDVVAWSNSLFNLGPGSAHPEHIHHTMDLAYDDYNVVVPNGRHPAYVIPAGPRGSGDNATIDFSQPGSKVRYGPRHEYSKAAFELQTVKPPRYRGKVVEGERRRRGRPRIDGLPPGSAEARAADEAKRRDRAARREAREAAKSNGHTATITKLPERKRRLVRVGKQKKQATS